MSYRADFADFEGSSYLNAAYQGPLPRVALTALEEAVRVKTQPWRFDDARYFDLPDDYRRALAAILGLPAERALEIAVTDSTIHAIQTLTTGLDWLPGDEVVIPKGEFPSNRFPWLALERRGVVVKEVEISSSATAAAELDAATSPRTRVVSVGWVHYSTGRRFDLDAVGEVARRRGALFAIDASQGLGGLPFSLAETRCDVLAGSVYKWLLAPYGLGFGWFSPELAERLEPHRFTWFSIRGARDFAQLGRCALELEPGARRFDIHQTANLFNLMPAIASFRYVHQIGSAQIGAHVQALLDRVIAGLPASVRPVSPIDSRSRSNILCVAGEGSDWSERAATELVRRDVRVSRREGSLRISPHLYNDESDIDRLLEGLEAADSGRTSSVVVPRAAVLPVGEPVDAHPASAPERASLAGATIELRPLDAERHADALFRVSHGDAERESLWTYMGYGPFSNLQAMTEWLRTCAAASDPLFFTVFDRASGDAMGMVSFLNVVAGARRLELGHIWYAPEWQRGRANAEAIELMLEAAFDRWGYRRVEWKCDALNARSRRAALRLGFVYEGLFRNHLIVKGRNRDTAWYAMTDDEWRRSRRASSAAPG